MRNLLLAIITCVATFGAGNDVKISELPITTNPTRGTAYVPISQGTTTYRSTVQTLTSDKASTNHTHTANQSAVYVNGTNVSSPTFTNSATVTWAISGSNITATAAGGGGGSGVSTNLTSTNLWQSFWIVPLAATTNISLNLTQASRFLVTVTNNFWFTLSNEPTDTNQELNVYVDVIDATGFRAYTNGLAGSFTFGWGTNKVGTNSYSLRRTGGVWHYDQFTAQVSAASVGSGDVSDIEFQLLNGLTGIQPLDADLTAIAGLSGVQGDVIYHNGTQWTRLAAGTSGYYLKTTGAGSNPAWDAVAGSGNWSDVGTTNASLVGIAYAHKYISTNGFEISGSGPAYWSFGDTDDSQWFTLRSSTNSTTNTSWALPPHPLPTGSLLGVVSGGTWTNAAGVEHTDQYVTNLVEVTDAQVPNNITVDLATTATTANAGDSATAFFSAGEIEDARLPSALTRDTEWDTIGEIETATGVDVLVKTEIDTQAEFEAKLFTLPSGGSHTVLSATHTDTVAATVVRGDLMVGNSTPAWERLPVGYHGAILTPWVDTNNAISLVWKKAPWVTEFMGSAVGEWTTFTANSGAVATGANAPDTADPGTWSISTGVLTNGVAGYRANQGGWVFGTNNLAIMWRIKTPSALSSDTDGYEIYSGAGDGTTDAEPVDGAYFYYTHGVSNGVWCAKTSSNSIRTFASGAPTTPPAVAASTWYNLLLEGNNSLVNFWVSSNDGQTWQFIGFCSADIPNTTSRVTGAESYIRKIGPNPGGTTARIAYLGRCEFWPNRGN
jgi:hypothetical protein